MANRSRRGSVLTVLGVALALGVAPEGAAADLDADVAALRDAVAGLRAENAEIQRRLDAALQTLARLERDAAVPAPAAAAGRRRDTSTPRVRLIDVSLAVDTALGASTERDEEIARLQGGGHDPRQRGFTLQQAELSLMGAVDPYLRGEAHLIAFLTPEGESEFEIEEAFLTTQSLPWGLQLEVGHFFTEFGRINPSHPHRWHWQNQPVILSRLFGPDGMRGPGARVGWLTPLPWFSEVHVGVQNARGETMRSFLGEDEAIGGRPFVERETQRLDDLVWLARWTHGWDLGETVAASLGLSALFGPNASGEDGVTRIQGADLVMKWRPVTQRRGWPFVVLESELVRRDYVADDAPGLPSETLQDWGGYAQALWGFRPRWAAGLRLEWASGSGASDGGRKADPFRDNRLRVSPLLAFYPSEFSRLRLQYNYDRADHLRRDDAHSVWLGFEFGIGAHPAHAF